MAQRWLGNNLKDLMDFCKPVLIGEIKYDKSFLIQTDDGVRYVYIGDYVVQFQDDKRFEAYKPDDFLAKFEAVDG
jgi:hypothetical protein